MTRRAPADLRSARWFGPADLRSFGHRSRTKQMGYAAQDWAGKPVIGILNTWSDINPCHQHFRIRAEEVKRGVWQAGGFPVEIPVAVAAARTFMKPSTMMYRNLLALEVEEDRSAATRWTVLVLLGGCDKTTPALIMGADQSADLPGDLFSRRADAARRMERASPSAAAPTPGNTGPSAAPATLDACRLAARSKTASPARPATA